MQDTFVTIARFPYSTEAQIAKGRLEAVGIEVFLRDNLKAYKTNSFSSLLYLKHESKCHNF